MILSFPFIRIHKLQPFALRSKMCQSINWEIQYSDVDLNMVRSRSCWAAPDRVGRIRTILGGIGPKRAGLGS